MLLLLLLHIRHNSLRKCMRMGTHDTRIHFSVRFISFPVPTHVYDEMVRALETNTQIQREITTLVHFLDCCEKCSKCSANI